jgi:uncharacterized repeat protein (TIGR03803 family)
VVEDSNGVLYGTTIGGDKYNAGNVYALTKSGNKWVDQTIWAFGGKGDGAQPYCDLVIDKAGNLFGTTYGGGARNAGTVCWEPYAGLLMVGEDTFYGTTWYGGNAGGDGTVFKLFRSGGKWKEKVIFSFNGADGYEPWGTLIRDQNGALYGTTYAGGANDEGVVFMLTPSGGKWTETVLHEFDSFKNQDGANPLAGLAWSPSGSLYGTTAEGGTPGYPGVGIVFGLSQSGGVWTETILHSFEGNSDGSSPRGSVVVDKDGALYGTTVGGGSNNFGTVWKITP